MVPYTDSVAALPSLQEVPPNDDTAILILEVRAELYALKLASRDFLSAMMELKTKTNERIFRSRELLRLLDARVKEARLYGWT
jgi:hypothetical protein